MFVNNCVKMKLPTILIWVGGVRRSALVIDTEEGFEKGSEGLRYEEGIVYFAVVGVND